MQPQLLGRRAYVLMLCLPIVRGLEVRSSLQSRYKPMTKLYIPPKEKLKLFDQGVRQLSMSLSTWDEKCFLEIGCNSSSAILGRIIKSFNWALENATYGPEKGAAGWAAIENYLTTIPYSSSMYSKLISTFMFDTLWDSLDKFGKTEVSPESFTGGNSYEQAQRKVPMQDGVFFYMFKLPQVSFMFTTADLDLNGRLSKQELYSFIQTWSLIGMMRFRQEITDFSSTCHQVWGCNNTITMLNRLANKMEFGIRNASVGGVEGFVIVDQWHKIIPFLTHMYLKLAYVRPFAGVWSWMPKNVNEEVTQAGFNSKAGDPFQRGGMDDKMVPFMFDIADLDNSGGLTTEEFRDFIHSLTHVSSVQPVEWNVGVVNCWVGVYHGLDYRCV